jgi:uncharacterized protein involved in exopolysaccharide biosynthesis
MAEDALVHGTPADEGDSPFQGFLTAAFTYKRRMLVAALAVLGLACTAAAVMKSKYAAHASLLALLGTEYTYRPLAGQPASSNGALEREEVLRTEIEILGSDDLHRALIRRIGLQRLYPDYLEPPGLVASALKFVLGLPSRVADSVTGETRERTPLDPVELALVEFDANFAAVAVKSGNSVELSFTHEDPDLAAEALNTLDAMYLDLRKSVFSDRQSALVEAQVAKLRDALATADSRLAEFRMAHGASAFQTRREIVLHAQGDAAKELQDAGSAVGQGEARVAALRAQLARLAPNVQSGQDTEMDQRLAPLRASLDALHARETELLASYRDDSAPVQTVRGQIAAREAEMSARSRDRLPSGFHLAQNPLREGVGGDLLRAQADLDAARVRRAHAQAALLDLDAQLRTLNEQERRLDQLDRQRQVADDAYRAGAKLLEERRITDDLEARKQASVRVLQPATVPIKAKPTRKLVVLGGFVLALFAAPFAVILSNLMRQSYLTTGEIERDLGVAVLACVPERDAGAVRALALRPVHA